MGGDMKKDDPVYVAALTKAKAEFEAAEEAAKGAAKGAAKRALEPARERRNTVIRSAHLLGGMSQARIGELMGLARKTVVRITQPTAEGQEFLLPQTEEDKSDG
jgi:DNA-directed RNA polymerase specialized sigma24 family protein